MNARTLRPWPLAHAHMSVTLEVRLLGTFAIVHLFESRKPNSLGMIYCVNANLTEAEFNRWADNIAVSASRFHQGSTEDGRFFIYFREPVLGYLP